MRIVIDLQSCQSESRFRGIGRYSMSLAKAIVRQASNHEIWLVLNDRFPDTIPFIRHEFDELVPKERIAVFAVHGSVAEDKTYNFWRTHAAEKIREYFLSGLQPDIVHVASLFEGLAQDVVSSIGAFNNKLPTVATLYDLIPLIHQETYLPDKLTKDYYLRKIHSLKNANLLLAISDYTKQEAITALGFNDDQVVNISTAIDDKFTVRQTTTTEKKALFGRYKITKPFIMYAPGGFDERKNIRGLITAYSYLPYKIRNNYQLLITGRIPEEPFKNITLHINKLGIREDELIFTDYILDDDLIALYNLCDLFVFPSLYEGFGLPALEAMSCGAVVVASNTTSIPEVIGRKDALFDPTHPEAITKMIQHALTSENFRQNFRKHGLMQVKKFSWDASAKRAIEAFELVHKKNLNATKIKGADDHEALYRKLVFSLAKIKTNERPTDFDLLMTARSIAINNPVRAYPQLYVDISVLVHSDAKSGIQRVVRSILLELIQSPPHGYTVQPIYFHDHHYRYANRFVNEFLGKRAELPNDDVVEMVRGDTYLGLDLSAHLSIATHNHLKRLNILGIKLYFVVYDIIFAHHPEWWPSDTSNTLLNWLRSITEVCTGLVCISRSVAEEVREWLDINPPSRAEVLPIRHFHLGADIENSVPTTGFPKDASDVLKVLEAAPSFLMVGTVEPRKGHAQTLSAFEILWNKGLDVNLVIVGNRGWLVEKLVRRLARHPMFGKRLFWLEGVSDEYLEKIYTTSTCLLAPSEAEGFGLPLIEAAQKKLPIIARDIPVFREVAGKHAFYFQGLEPEKLAEAIKAWIDLWKQNLAPSSEEMPWLTWAESSKRLMNCVLTESEEIVNVKNKK